MESCRQLLQLLLLLRRDIQLDGNLHWLRRWWLLRQQLRRQQLLLLQMLLLLLLLLKLV